MGKSLNKVQLIGNLGKDPELKYTPIGVAVATFSIATSDSWKDKDGELHEQTEWHNIVVWRKLAEIVGQYLKKGMKVFVEGKLKHRSYDDNSGVKRYVTEVVIDNLIMLGSPSGKTQPPLPEDDGETAIEKDDLPF
jgi:single-strand DNA-binding protein